MLKRTKLKNAKAAAVYFEKDDYYTRQEDQSPSQWWGQGAKALGLDGEVDRQTFQGLLEGLGPDGQPLRLSPNKNKGQVIGYDFTFSAPKSLSMKALVDGDTRLALAHREAVQDALLYIERVGGAQTRVTKNRVSNIEETENLTVAQFHHETSRELDPQLHTHCVAINATKCADGKWRTLYNDVLYAKDFELAAGNFYKASLARRVQDLGYELQLQPEGFELAGYEKEQLEHFSKRAQQIDDYVKENNLKGSVAKDHAALKTRAQKQDVDRTKLREKWIERAQAVKAHELIQPKSPEQISAQPAPPKKALEQEERVLAQQGLDDSLSHLTERNLGFSERQLTRQAMGRAIGKARPEAVLGAIQKQKDKGALLEADSLKPGLSQFTTQDAVDIERDILKLEKNRRQTHLPIMEPKHVEQRLQKTVLGEDQRAAVLMGLSSRDGVVAVQGYAGTGKTTMLDQVRALAEEQGFEVKGFAPSKAATDALSQGAKIDSQTLQKHLLDLKKDRAPIEHEGDPKVLWVLDEASMVSNKAMHDLLRQADRHQARVVLVGDKDQLPSIDAGAAFSLLQSRGIAQSEMTQIRRQQDKTLLQAVKDVIDKQEAQAIERLKGHITQTPDRVERLSQVAKAYLDTEKRDQTLVITPANDDRVLLNQKIREGLKAEQTLKGQDVKVDVLVSRGLTQQQSQEALSYQVGDVVRFGRAYKRELQVEKGEQLTVKAIEGDNNQVVLLREDGSQVHWRPRTTKRIEVYKKQTRELAVGDLVQFTKNDKDKGHINGQSAKVVALGKEGLTLQLASQEKQTLSYSAPLHLDHGYAVTVYKSQGQTVDKLIAHIDTAKKELIGHEAFYVAISRQRKQIELHTDDAKKLPSIVRAQMTERPALDMAKSPQRAQSQDKAPEQVPLTQRHKRDLGRGLGR